MTHYEGRFLARVLTEYSKSARVEQTLGESLVRLTVLSLITSYKFSVLRRVFLGEGHQKLSESMVEFEFSIGKQPLFTISV